MVEKQEKKQPATQASFELTHQNVKRITVEEPHFDTADASLLRQAILDRIHSKFKESQEALENLLEYVVNADSRKHLSFKGLWLTNQIFKTQYKRGHFKQALEKIGPLLDELDAEFSFTTESEGTKVDAERDKFEYVFFKLLYVKAKLLRKTRQMQECDDTCTFIIDYVKEKAQDGGP